MVMEIPSMDLVALWLTPTSQFMVVMLILMMLNSGQSTAIEERIFSKLLVSF
jgi:hypothetical protein